ITFFNIVDLARRIRSQLDFFFLPHLPTTDLYTLSLHDALPISNLYIPERDATVSALFLAELMAWHGKSLGELLGVLSAEFGEYRSEEHTSELQSRFDLVCRLLLEKKNSA